MRNMLKTIIYLHKPSNVLIRECDNAPCGIERCDEFLPDLVLLDAELKPDNGFLVAETLLKRHPGLKIVMLTQYISSYTRKKADELQIMGFVRKDQLSILDLYL